ncbi:hypothetical protein [Epilithonimonas sp.]|uniref:hypothetical protein n=1 Tax=Epilithonimonas sp. TaxID=2894511 RepID=UPI0035B30344
MKTKIKTYLEKLETLMFYKEGDSSLQSAQKLGLKEAYFLAKEILQKKNTTNEDSIFPPISELTAKEDLEKYPNSLFWFHGDIFILELEKSDDNLIAWVNYSKIWNPISIKTSWNYDETQAFLKVRIEEHFKLRDVTPESKIL